MVAISSMVVALVLAAAPAEPVSITVSPAEFALVGADSRQQLLVTGVVDGRPTDLTRSATFAIADGAPARVGADGVVLPAGDGSATVVVRVGALEAKAIVRVSGSAKPLPVGFERDIQAILTKAGCNAGACHGKQRGQNGFALSLLGFDADFDYAAVAQEARGRRVFPSAPQRSLLLTKPLGLLPHGGGVRLTVGKYEYDTLLRWIADGMPRNLPADPEVQRIAIEPTHRILLTGSSQQLRVTAHYSDGSTRDVTHLTAFQSNESVIAAVSSEGLIKAGSLPGEAAVMGRFMEKFAVCNIAIPQAGKIPDKLYADLPRNNFIDGHVWDKLRTLAIAPSPAADDATYLRRAYLDVIGRQPSADEARAFAAEPASPTKRAALIDRLLQRPEYADHWANKWADLLRPNPYRVGIKATYMLDAWLRESFRRNKPYDQFVRELVAAQGSTFRNGAAVVFRDRREPDELTTMISRLFLGVRLDCARCHHHPFEIWSQDDFYSFAAFFAKVGRKGTGISPPISGSEEIVFSRGTGQVTHPATGKVMDAKPLFGSVEAAPPGDEPDPRVALAAWMTAPANRYFSQVIVNRVWADLMGRGLVEPVDDLRATNPPSNGPLLDALADDFRAHKFDHKHLIRTICASHVYGLASTPGEANTTDVRNHSRHYRQRLRAEVLLDAICDITGVPEAFSGAPTGTRAMELWTARTQSVFLDSFGRPDPNQDPPCERTAETSVVQVLHLMNSPNLYRKISADTGRAAKLAASTKKPEEIVDELYLSVYSRAPTEPERRACVGVFGPDPKNRRRTVEDLMWALINTPEFLFKD